ncbi:hypothetical protein K9M74_03880 [Candidatus Woesearchaeota archaeon]|nr:hypothetical protein [Candidatus Woesearchaeota archaeon]
MNLKQLIGSLAITGSLLSSGITQAQDYQTRNQIQEPRPIVEHFQPNTLSIARPMRIYASPDIDPNKEHALVILTRGYGAQQGKDQNIMGYDHDTKEFGYSEELLRDNFNTYIALVDKPSEFMKAHELAQEHFNDSLDFLYVYAHGLSQSLMVDGKKYISADKLFSSELASYYSSQAKGRLNACRTANPDYENNFAQQLANAAQIPVQGAINFTSLTLSDEYDLQEGLSAQIGFNSATNKGFFNSANKKTYEIKKITDNKYISIHEPNKLPADFKEDEVYYFDDSNVTQENIRTLYPQQSSIEQYTILNNK